ncbi:MAG: Asp-tRNA(Asn)/Glu-tRNA(Gln) amidotransferase subunit GatC [bacterium]|nr:Asp-tRNA(Asn)/Glu-tRNA(Gln) amidotransferase subunit GatC [bacterium]
MKIDEKQARYVADLANLELSDEEIRRFAGDMTDILTHMDKLNELPTDDVEPMAQVLFDQDETATLRDDVPRETLDSDTALANAPVSGRGHFKVPRVIER